MTHCQLGIRKRIVRSLVPRPTTLGRVALSLVHHRQRCCRSHPSAMLRKVPMRIFLRCTPRWSRAHRWYNHMSLPMLTTLAKGVLSLTALHQSHLWRPSGTRFYGTCILRCQRRLVRPIRLSSAAESRLLARNTLSRTPNHQSRGRGRLHRTMYQLLPMTLVRAARSRSPRHWSQVRGRLHGTKYQLMIWAFVRAAQSRPARHLKHGQGRLRWATKWLIRMALARAARSRSPRHRSQVRGRCHGTT
mmetsp:Transcript_2342/g.6903  ORF Transcript_2342/g.6903 Transcript_2342/m.6903 type:complete len:246 (-) Transcript_2342:3433-4170(-)